MISVGAQERSLQGKIWEDKRVILQNMTPTTTKEAECVYSCESIVNKGVKVMIYYDHGSYYENTAVYLLKY